MRACDLCEGKRKAIGTYFLGPILRGERGSKEHFDLCVTCKESFELVVREWLEARQGK